MFLITEVRSDPIETIRNIRELMPMYSAPSNDVFEVTGICRSDDKR